MMVAPADRIRSMRRRGAGNMNKMNGSLFSPDFHATYALEMNVSGTTFNLDQYNLLSTTATFLGSFPLTNGQGSAANLQGIAAGFNNNLTGGITTGSANHGSAVSASAAQAVNTGIELAIPLSTFGNPSNIKVMVALNGNGDSGLSNQVLPGVQVGTDNIKTQPGTLVSGQPAVNPYYLGTTGNSTEFSFANFPGQYFTVPVPVIPNGNWLPPGGGSWGTAGNWSNSIIPGIGGDAATFTTATGASAVMLDGMRTIGALTINSSNSYTFAAGTGGVLVMDNAGSQAAINDLGGVHIISAPGRAEFGHDHHRAEPRRRDDHLGEYFRAGGIDRIEQRRVQRDAQHGGALREQQLCRADDDRAPGRFSLALRRDCRRGRL